MKWKIWYVLYLIFASWLPETRRLRIAGKIRYYFAKRILGEKIHKTSNIERKAEFGPKVEIGEKSGIGVNCKLYGSVKIGKYVMMGPDCVIFTSNHEHKRTDIPMIEQGFTEEKPVVIEDDVWIGERCMIMPGVTIAKGCIVAAGAIVTKSTEPYTILGGVPAKVVASRLDVK